MSLKFRNSFIFLSCFLALTQARMIYRRYEKEHQNYVQIVEIFETIQKPPPYSENERALNNFLGREAFRTDMNCTEGNSSEKIETTTKQKKSTTRQAIKSTTNRLTTRTPSTIFQLSTDSMMTYSPLPFPKLTTPSTRMTTTSKPLNLDHISTTRSTKPTIKPNPKENVNPDYSELDRSSLPVSKIPKIASPHAGNGDRKNTLENVDSQSPPSKRPNPNHVHDYSVENGEYNENNYEIIDSDEAGEFDEEVTIDPDDYEEESDDENDYDAMNRRRKRMHAISKRLSRKRHSTSQVIS